MMSGKIGERIALIARGPGMVKYYTQCGFKDKRASDVRWSGGGWRSLVYDFPAEGWETGGMSGELTYKGDDPSEEFGGEDPEELERS